MTTYATETTDLIPTPETCVAGGCALPIADDSLCTGHLAKWTNLPHALRIDRTKLAPLAARLVELDEFEIVRRYGDVLWNGLIAFATDANYFADIVEAANLIEYKQELWKARDEAKRRGADDHEVSDWAQDILAERGVSAPPSRGRRRN